MTRSSGAGSTSATTMSPKLIQARELASAGKPVEAGRLLTELLRTEPKNFAARCMLGLVGLQQGQFAAAERELRLAVKLNPGSAVAHNHLGLAGLGLGRSDQALASFDRAIALRPDFADAHRNRANALKALGRFEEAMQSFRRASPVAAAGRPAARYDGSASGAGFSSGR
jgi:Tfp pilus assembly protein PilF